MLNLTNKIYLLLAFWKTPQVPAQTDLLPKSLYLKDHIRQNSLGQNSTGPVFAYLIDAGTSEKSRRNINCEIYIHMQKQASH